MASCQAGECEVECTGKGCGCIAESDRPEICSCFCAGGQPSKDLKLEPATPVDVSISELTFFEAAKFLNEVHTERIVVPINKMNEQVSLNLTSKPFVDVLNQLGLTTSEGIERGKRRIGLLMFLAGFTIGALIFSLVFSLRNE
jgi:hypothetical protein